MTKENQEIRDKLKTAEQIITTALASQPDDDDQCRQHLLKAYKNIAQQLMSIDFIVACEKGIKESLKC